MIDLHTTTLGEDGSPVIFCHGLFGQGKNWTQIAKQVAVDHRVVLADMPNHGRSAWTDRFDYAEAADAAGEAATMRTAGPAGRESGPCGSLSACRRPDCPGSARTGPT